MLSGLLLSDEDISFTVPEPEEIEISVFGSGFGECIVIHVGFGKWMVIDSCIARSTYEPVALRYFDRLGIDVADAVTMILATHWHDDHVCGIAQLFEKAESAQFYMSAALRGQEFLALAKRRDLVSRFSRGVDELAKVLLIVQDRKSSGGQPIDLVSAVKRLWYRERYPVKAIWGLSPSAEDLSRSIKHIASFLPTSSNAAARIPSLMPNDASVVVLLETVAGAILLGGDLEHFPGSRSRGWSALLDHGGRPTQLSTVFKLPHHGSVNGDCPEVWEHAVVQNALCMVSPFERGKIFLPRKTDRERIRNLTSNAFITSDKCDPAVRRDRAAEKMINEATLRYSPITLRLGHIQVRIADNRYVLRLSPEAAAI